MTCQGKNIIWSDYLIREIYLSGNALLKKNQFVRCKPICWKHFLYFHKILYIYCLPILYNKGKPLPIMLNDSYLSNIIRTWNCSKFWLFFITKVSFISLVLSDVKKFRIGFTSSVITFPYCNYSKKMSECLRTYGPQIIRVPQLQIEDWAWLVVPSYKLQN